MKNLIFTLLFTVTFLTGLQAQNEFITEWYIEEYSWDTTLQFPGEGVDYTIIWEEVGNPANPDTITNAQSGQVIKFSAPGTYLVKAMPGSGTFNGFNVSQYYNNSSNLLFVRQWGNIAWTSMEGAFWGCYNMDVTATDVPDLSLVKSMKNMFASCSNLTGNSSFSNWNTSGVEDMSNMFQSASKFNQNINNWNTQNVRNMSYMFTSTQLFNQPLNNWNTSNVSDMSYMFSNTYSFNQNIDSWNTANVTTMKSMFGLATFFNQPLNSWDMSSVEDISEMFYSAYSFNQPLNNWDVSNVKTMNSTFTAATEFNQNINSWNTVNVTSMVGTFASTNSFNQPLNNWNVSNVTTMQSMFSSSLFNQDISNWNTSGVRNMSSMFIGSAFNQPLNDWDVSNVENFSSMFTENFVFNQPLNNWNTGKATNMSGMFRNAISFNSDINNWNTWNVRDMSFMFSGATAFNQDITEWRTGNVREMMFMFNDATSFNQPIGKWNLGSVLTMGRILNNATSFNQSLSNWYIGNLHFNTSIGLANSGIDCNNYSETLQSWATVVGIRHSLILDATGLTYNTQGQAARNTLITSKQWTINGDTYDANCSTLPVNLISFNLEKQKDKILVKWETATETNNKGFFVERSNDGESFEALHFVASKGAGSNYSFTDNNPADGRNYYRLKQIDLNGAAAFHEIKFIEFTRESEELKLYPNPVTNGVVNLRHENNAAITIFNSAGQAVKRVFSSGSHTSINVSDLPKGIYFVRVNGSSLKLLVQ